MGLQELLKKGDVRKIEPSRERAVSLLVSAERDIKAAGDMLSSGNLEWALAVAYNSMLACGMAIMAEKGYAPSSEAHHLAVVRFCSEVMSAQAAPLMDTFNKYRVRRHEVVYGEAGSVGRNEAERAIENAKKFLGITRGRVT